jgi:hypothetical protein
MDSGFDLLHEPFPLMKAPDFRYIRPQSLAHPYRILEENAGAAVPLAGGENLPAGLQDNGEICLGALVRRCELLQSELVRSRLPLLTESAAHVGHWAAFAAPWAAVPRGIYRAARWGIICCRLPTACRTFTYLMWIRRKYRPHSAPRALARRALWGHRRCLDRRQGCA